MVTGVTQWKGYGHWCYTMEQLWSLVLHNAKVLVTVLQNRKVMVTDATQWKGYGHWGYKMERSWSLVLRN